MTIDSVLKKLRRALGFWGSSAHSNEHGQQLSGEEIPGGGQSGEIPGDHDCPFPDPVIVEFTDVLDLHSIPPSMVRGVVEDYLDAAHWRGFGRVRIIHGKGIGVQRELVRGILVRSPFVISFKDAPPEAGGLGATIATLVPKPSTDARGLH